jgi:hypothetical protein
VKVFEEAAAILKGENVLFAESDIEEGMQGKLAEYLGVIELQLP